MITKGCMEKAQNKPIVKGLCGKTRTKLFCDTGTDVNVIDKDLFKDLGQNDKCKIHSCRKTIRCANHSKVPNLFPQIILGIRAMKDFEMSVDPSKDCVWVNGVQEPFISKVNPQSLVSQNSGNGRLPGLRVEGRQM